MRVALVNGKIRLDEASITVEDEAQVPCDSSASDSDSESVAEDAEDAAAQRVRKRPHNLRTRRLHPKSTSGDGTSPWGASLSPALKRRRSPFYDQGMGKVLLTFGAFGCVLSPFFVLPVGMLLGEAAGTGTRRTCANGKCTIDSTSWGRWARAALAQSGRPGEQHFFPRAP
eukprot:scaffold7326_cov249-Pinguiococcus_pyrenoidosus.AAC.8